MTKDGKFFVNIGSPPEDDNDVLNGTVYPHAAFGDYP